MSFGCSSQTFGVTSWQPKKWEDDSKVQQSNVQIEKDFVAIGKLSTDDNDLPIGQNLVRSVPMRGNEPARILHLIVVWTWI